MGYQVVSKYQRQVTGESTSFASEFCWPCLRPTNLCPPPSGMLANLVTSTWIIEPG